MQHCPFGREAEGFGDVLPREGSAAPAFDRRRRLQDQVFEEVVVGAAGIPSSRFTMATVVSPR